MYFNYHAKAKRLIKELNLIDYQIVEEYNKIKPCLILLFKNHPPMPIREHKFNEYLDLIESIDYYDYLKR